MCIFWTQSRQREQLCASDLEQTKLCCADSYSRTERKDDGVFLSTSRQAGSDARSVGYPAGRALCPVPSWGHLRWWLPACCQLARSCAIPNNSHSKQYSQSQPAARWINIDQQADVGQNANSQTMSLWLCNQPMSLPVTSETQQGGPFKHERLINQEIELYSVTGSIEMHLIACTSSCYLLFHTLGTYIVLWTRFVSRS